MRVNSTLSSAERIAALADSTAAVGDLQIGTSLIVIAGRLEVLLAQFGRTPELPRRQLDLGFRLGQLGTHRGKRRLIGPRIDHEEQVSLLDDLPVGEMNFGQVAAHPRPDLDRIDRRKLPGKLVPLGDFLLQRQADGDRRRRWCGLCEDRAWNDDDGECQGSGQPEGKTGNQRKQRARVRLPSIVIPDFRHPAGFVFIQHG